MVSGYFSLLGQTIEVFAGVCIYSLVAILIHEAGHAVAALLFGFEVVAVRVGPTDLKWEKRWSLTLNKGRWDIGFVRAQFRRVPGRWAALRCFVYILGGPLTNVCVAVLLAPFSLGSSFVGSVCGYVMLASVIVGGANLIPFKSKLGLSDGANILWILFRRRQREDFIFRLSLKARVKEIVELSRSHKFQEAIDEIDRLKARFLMLPGVNPDAVQNLLKMRDTFEKALAMTLTPDSPAQALDA